MIFEQITVDDVPRHFVAKFNCAQMTLGHASQYLNLAEADAVRMGALFGTGMRRGETCGAVTGALMALSYKFGNEITGDEATKMQAFAKAQEFEKRFIGELESLKCRDILGYDVSTQSGLEAILKNDLFNTVCPKVIVTACKILDDMLA